MKKTNIKTLTIISIAFMISFTIIVTLYTYVVRNLLLSETKIHLTEVAEQGAKLAKYELEADIERLQILGTNEVFKSDLSTIEDKINVLKTEVERKDFLRIGYADLNGNSVTTDDYNLYVGDRNYFIESISGNGCISEPLEDRLNNFSAIIVCSVPIYKDHKVDAVLYAARSIEKLENAIQITSFAGNGYSYITDSDGKIIFHPDNKPYIDNIFDIIKEDEDTNNYEQFNFDLKNNATNTLRIKFDDGDNYIGYAPIKDINNWYLVSCVPASIVFKESSIIIELTLLVTFIISLMLIGLFTYIYVYKKNNEKYIENLAYVDKITGIHNYNKFYANCLKLLQNKSSKNYAVIYFDIDNFKVINDTIGYGFGNKILCHVAETLKQLFRNGEAYGRLSNDYFGILMTYNNVVDVIKIINTISESLKGIKIDNNANVNVEISAGIYLVKDDDKDINRIINSANMARGTIKGMHQKHYAIFDEKIRKSLYETNSLENDIKLALRNNEFIIFYQPKFDIKTRNMVGSEALLRWMHPKKGFLNPGLFIPLAEKSGLIVDIGKWVLEKVCIDMTEWVKLGIDVLPVSVNLSRVELYQSDLIESVESTISKYGLATDLIEIELTESAALNDLKLTEFVINKFKNIGLKVSMDDFGTGYSSLSCLRSIPIDILKLDKTFLNDIETDERSRNIACAIINLAKSLNLITVAEGVETELQIQFLLNSGCDIVQGYYFAKPMPKEEFTGYLTGSNVKNKQEGDNIAYAN